MINETKNAKKFEMPTSLTFSIFFPLCVVLTNLNLSLIFDSLRSIPKTKISKTIATLIAVQHGVDMVAVTSKFDSKIAGLVTTALATVVAGAIVSANDDGVIKL